MDISSLLVAANIIRIIEKDIGSFFRHFWVLWFFNQSSKSELGWGLVSEIITYYLCTSSLLSTFTSSLSLSFIHLLKLLFTAFIPFILIVSKVLWDFE